ncbi:MAG: class I SAM-dependent methyltransferase [Terriglobales bacterium]|jgi:SAM-dependent methyltransferase
MNRSEFEWTPDFWQGWRESDNPYRRYKSHRDRRLVLETLELHDGEKVLEVGFGYGWISQCIWNAAKIDWYGVDRSAAMACRIRRLELKEERRVALADGVSLPFQDGEFDKVLCTGVLMHIAETDLAVRELVRVLRHGGRIVCSINNSLSPYSFPVRIWNRRKKGFVQKFRNPTSFRKFLYETGVVVDGMQGDGIVATVPVRIGKYQFPPLRAYLSIQKLDEWAVDRFPWFAYEIWFSGLKTARP